MVLRIIYIKLVEFPGKFFCTSRILFEHFLQMDPGNVFLMFDKFLPAAISYMFGCSMYAHKDIIIWVKVLLNEINNIRILMIQYSVQLILPDSVSLSMHRESLYKEWHIVHDKACLAGNGAPLSRGSTQSMGIDKLTHRASPLHPAAALQRLGREQPFPVHCALLRNTTAALKPTISVGRSTSSFLRIAR